MYLMSGSKEFSRWEKRGGRMNLGRNAKIGIAAGFGAVIIIIIVAACSDPGPPPGPSPQPKPKPAPVPQPPPQPAGISGDFVVGRTVGGNLSMECYSIAP